MKEEGASGQTIVKDYQKSLLEEEEGEEEKALICPCEKMPLSP